MKITEIRKNRNGKSAFEFNIQKAEEARAFHRTVPGYEPTPLCRLNNLAKFLGVREFYVKDESRRFGLNAFKSLGGSFAMSRILESTGEKKTFVTATDGNHGRGVAWAAKMLGQKAVVYLPKGTAAERLENIRALGAHAEILDLIYDDCVRYAVRMAEENGWILIQDTSWEGYEEIPAMIMQGYTTMGLEIAGQLGDTVPTHVFLQAGVGSFAGAMASFLADFYGEQKPVIAIVEPTGADCIFKTAEAADGQMHFVTELNSIMAGLNCGEPCTLAWEMIEKYADFAISCEDFNAADGMRILGNPLPGDERIISGESGASAAGTAANILLREENAGIREKLGLDEKSVVLCISTEGATDRENYRNIAWFGKYAG